MLLMPFGGSFILFITVLILTLMEQLCLGVLVSPGSAITLMSQRWSQKNIWSKLLPCCINYMCKVWLHLGTGKCLTLLMSSISPFPSVVSHYCQSSFFFLSLSCLRCPAFTCLMAFPVFCCHSWCRHCQLEFHSSMMLIHAKSAQTPKTDFDTFWPRHLHLWHFVLKNIATCCGVKFNLCAEFVEFGSQSLICCWVELSCNIPGDSQTPLTVPVIEILCFSKDSYDSTSIWFCFDFDSTVIWLQFDHAKTTWWPTSRLVCCSATAM